MMKSTIKLIFAAAAVVLVACQKEEASAPSNFPKDGVIRVATNVELPTTRGGMTTDNLRMFSINIENTASATHSYFAYFEKAEGGIWSSYADEEKKTQLTMLWQNSTQPITVTAVSRDGDPFLKQEFTEIQMLIISDQRDEEDFKFSDYLYMAPTVINPATDLTSEGKLPVTFKHLLSKVNLSITLGTEFNIAPGTTPNPISELKINGTKCWFRWTPSVSGKLEPTNEIMAITPFVGPYTPGNGTTPNAVANYEVILVPQTVAEKGFSVSFTIGGKPYTWTSNAAVTLEQGKLYTLDITAGENTTVKSIVKNGNTTVNTAGENTVTASKMTATEWEINK